MTAPSTTRCLQVDVDAAEVDTVSALLWAGGATAVQELGLGDDQVRLIAGLPADAERELTAALSPRWRVEGFDAHHDGWLDAWRPFARPVRVGRVVVHPPWTSPESRPGAGDGPPVLVAIDPGRAFGQGSHVSTRLAVGALDAVIRRGCSVLDVGCGSGVLAVVAARLGAGRVVAVDIDEEAVVATRANAAGNGVDGVVQCSATPIGEVDGRFDVVVANILAPVLVELAPAIAERVAAGGVVLLSGFLGGQRDVVSRAYVPPLEPGGEAREDDWVLLRLGRPR